MTALDIMLQTAAAAPAVYLWTLAVFLAFCLIMGMLERAKRERES